MEYTIIMPDGVEFEQHAACLNLLSSPGLLNSYIQKKYRDITDKLISLEEANEAKIYYSSKVFMGNLEPALEAKFKKMLKRSKLAKYLIFTDEGDVLFELPKELPSGRTLLIGALLRYGQERLRGLRVALRLARYTDNPVLVLASVPLIEASGNYPEAAGGYIGGGHTVFFPFEHTKGSFTRSGGGWQCLEAILENKPYKKVYSSNNTSSRFQRLPRKTGIGQGLNYKKEVKGPKPWNFFLGKDMVS